MGENLREVLAIILRHVLSGSAGNRRPSYMDLMPALAWYLLPAQDEVLHISPQHLYHLHVNNHAAAEHWSMA